MNDPYTYDGTEVLINKANIRDQKKLDDFESTMVQLALIDLFKKDNWSVSVNSIFRIHAKLFSEVYDWAGEKRTINIVKYEPILDGMSVQYSDYNDIEHDLGVIETKLSGIIWDNLSIDQKIANIANIIADIWKVHTFREGNTRTISVFLQCLMTQMGFNLNSKFISNNAKYFRNALVMASLGKYRENQYLENILKGAISDLKINEKSEQYRTIKGFDVTKYTYNYHKSR